MINGFKFVLILILCTCSSILFSQLTIVVENAKDFHDTIANKIYVAGNYNNWNPADAKSKLKWVGGKLQVTLDLSVAVSTVEFKFTAGSWENGEVKMDGSQLPNRTCNYKPGMIITQRIESFQHLAPKKIALANTSIIKFKVYSPELKVEKQIRVSLPCGYATSNVKYPVLYMLDGQNLFDDVDAYSGEWGIDEAMDSVCAINKLPAIIVGIDHAGDLRLSEYSAFPIKKYDIEPMGDDFAEFVAITLKSKIDSIYRTLPGRQFTGIGGSSIAAVAGMYIVLKYNNVFSKACVFSPAFWTNEDNFVYAENAVVNADTKIYFVAGAREDDYEVMKDAERMHYVLLDKRNEFLKTRYIIEGDGKHRESFWRDEFFDAFVWLYLE